MVGGGEGWVKKSDAMVTDDKKFRPKYEGFKISYFSSSFENITLGIQLALFVHTLQ